MIQFDKFIQPVVLYENCIFLKMHDFFFKKNEGKPYKNYKPVGGGEVVGYLIHLALLWRFLMHAKLFSAKKVVLKINMFGLCENR